jgi:hypothetical protein
MPQLVRLAGLGDGEIATELDDLMAQITAPLAELL